MRVGKLDSDYQTSSESRTELDSHADVTVVGKNALVLTDFNRPVTVTGYNPASKPMLNVKTVGAAIAYDDPTTGATIMLTIHQALHIPTLEHNLLCPMQYRVNQVLVNDVSKFLIDKPSNDDHAIIVDSKENGPTRIPLSLTGIVSYFPSRKPTLEEYESCEVHYELTSETPEWNPAISTFANQESSMTDSRGLIPESPLTDRHSPKFRQICHLRFDPYHPEEQDLATALSRNHSTSNCQETTMVRH